MKAVQMKIMAFVAAVASALLPSASKASELPDCKLEQGPLIKGLADHASKDQARYFLEVEGSLKSGVETLYDRDEPVLNVELRVIRTTPALMPTSDVRLKNSWALSPNFGFRKGRQLRIWRQIELQDGRKFAVLEFADGTLFVDETNQVCNKVYGKGVWQAGTLSIEPDGATIERGLVDDLYRSGSLRVIYLGTSAGAMKFQEVWVQGSRIGKSITRTFDQFAKSVDIAGFKFEVLEAKGDKAKLRYDIPSRAEISAAQLTQLPLTGSAN